MLDQDLMHEYGKYADRYLGPTAFTIPMVTEKTSRGERVYDLFSRLMEDRIIIIGGPIFDLSSTVTVGQLLFLQKEDKQKDISIYINSPGGVVNGGLSIYDTMQFITNDCATFCVGEAMSMGAILLAGGAKGKRFSLPHSRIMIHQPSGGAYGTYDDIERQTKEIASLKQISVDILAAHTGQKPAQIRKDIDRDTFMSAEEAKKYGLIDAVLVPQQDAKK